MRVGLGARPLGLTLGGCVLLSSLAALASPAQRESGTLLAAAAATAVTVVGRESADYVDRVTPAGQRARGLYFTYPYMRRFGPRGVAGLVKRARMNAAVLDLKDDQGRVSYRTEVEALKPQVVRTPLDLASMVAELRAAGVYTIARIVCFNDPSLPKREPERAILDGRPKHAGKQVPWVSWGTGDTWLNPYDVRNHDLFVQMADEAEALGFDEVQLDYIRFPVDRGTAHAVYTPSSDTPRRLVLLDLLRRVDAAIAIPLGVDVFGLTSMRNGDPTGLGQSLGDWTAHVEVFSPMLYVNAMPGWRTDVANRGHVLVKGLTYTLRQRLGPGPVIRPFLQAFENGLGTSYGPGFIADQVTGARGGEADGLLFWNPGANYGVVQLGMAQVAPGLMPQPSSAREAFRERVWAAGEHELSPMSERNDAYGW